jgi:hypothetical protein
MAIALGQYVKRWQRRVKAGLGVTVASPEFENHASVLVFTYNHL